MSSRVVTMPEGYRTSAEVWFEVVQASTKNAHGCFLKRGIQRLKFHWKEVVVAVGFWAVYGYSVTVWLTH